MNSSSLLQTGNLTKEQTKAGNRCANTRKEAAADRDSERDNGNSGSPYKRGIRTGPTKNDVAVANIALAADALDQRAREGEMLVLTHLVASKHKRCDLLLSLATMYPEGSAQRKRKMDEVRDVMDDISLLETKMESYYSQTAKRPRLSAVDSLLAATMNTAPSCHTGASASPLLTSGISAPTPVVSQVFGTRCPAFSEVLYHT
jgi:hypothetical protein